MSYPVTLLAQRLMLRAVAREVAGWIQQTVPAYVEWHDEALSIGYRYDPRTIVAGGVLRSARGLRRRVLATHLR